MHPREKRILISTYRVHGEDAYHERTDQTIRVIVNRDAQEFDSDGNVVQIYDEISVMNHQISDIDVNDRLVLDDTGETLRFGRKVTDDRLESKYVALWLQQ